MPSFQDSIFLFILALMLFGPKQLPKLARELGKWMGEFRRASNEFKMQMEEEMRISEQADRQKEIAAMEAAAPVQAAPSSEPAPPALDAPATEGINPELSTETPAPEASAATPEPLPIATAGDLKIMPPATGLPTPRAKTSDALGGLIDSIPEVSSPETYPNTTESALHGD